MAKQVKVMRGISGAGKSTMAKRLADHEAGHGASVLICSADDFFMDENGVYQFDGAKLGAAHKACLKKFLRALQDGIELVVVDNTNINLEDMAPYVALGEAFDYDVEILQVNTSAAVATVRNVHGVPSKSVQGMESRLSTVKVPARYKLTHIHS